MNANANYNPITQSGGFGYSDTASDHRERRKDALFSGGLVLVVIGVIAVLIWYLWTNTWGKVVNPAVEVVNNAGKTVTDVVSNLQKTTNTLITNPNGDLGIMEWLFPTSKTLPERTGTQIVNGNLVGDQGGADFGFPMFDPVTGRKIPYSEWSGYGSDQLSALIGSFATTQPNAASDPSLSGGGADWIGRT